MAVYARSSMTDLYWKDHGGSGPALLLVHGMLSSTAQWIYNVAPLKEVCRPITVDLLGHGQSPAPDNPACYQPEWYLDQFETIRKEIGAEQWFVCGQSFGATLTLRYALERPERVLGQIFTNSASALARADDAKMMIEGAAKQAKALALGKVKVEDMPIHPVHAKRLDPAARQKLIEEAALVNVASLALTFSETLAHGSQATRFHETTVPTLLVVGTRETRFDPHRRFAERALASLEVVDVDAGHAVNIDGADTFNVAVAAFIERHKL